MDYMLHMLFAGVFFWYCRFQTTRLTLKDFCWFNRVPCCWSDIDNHSSGDLCSATERAVIFLGGHGQYCLKIAVEGVLGGGSGGWGINS